MSTTASPPESPPPLGLIDSTPATDMDVTGIPATVAWGAQSSSSLSESLSGVTLDLHHNVRSNRAFFKLRVMVSLKAVPPRTRRTPLYIFLRPEHILTLSVDDSQTERAPNPTELPHASASSLSLSALGPNPTRLVFSLAEYPQVVVPKVSLAPRSKASGVVLDKLRHLQTQLDMVVYASISSRALGLARLQSLCELVSNHELTSISAHGNVDHCYGGQGGRLLLLEAAAPAPPPPPADNNRGEVNSPPSYDELAPSPARPVLAVSATGKRRRRTSSSPPLATSTSNSNPPLDRKYIEEVCGSMIEARLSSMQAQMAEQLTGRLTDELGELRSELLQHVEERLDDLREELHQDTAATVEDEYITIKNELDDLIKDEVGHARDSILDSLSNARFSLRIDDE